MTSAASSPKKKVRPEQIGVMSKDIKTQSVHFPSEIPSRVWDNGFAYTRKPVEPRPSRPQRAIINLVDVSAARNKSKVPIVSRYDSDSKVRRIGGLTKKPSH